MEENRDLFSYLQEQTSDGQMESQGEFTISLDTARKKLAKFALPRSYAWVSKLVQAAVGWGMEKIEIAQTWMETEFYFKPSDASNLTSEKELLRALLSGQVLTEDPLAQFCLALRALVEQANLSFLLVVNDGKSNPKPLYAGAFYSRQSESKRLTKCYNKALGITLFVRHSYSLSSETPVPQLVGLRSNGLPVFEELQDYAYFSPVPISLKGKRLDGFMVSPHFRYAWQIPLALSGLKGLAHSPEEFNLPDSYEEKQLSFLTSRRRAQRTYGGETRFQCAYSISCLSKSTPPRFTSQLSSLNWIRDGVVVQTSTLPIKTTMLGLQIYADASGLKSDLTGFQLIEDQDKVEREREIYDRLAPATLGWIPRIHDFFREDRDESSTEDDRMDRLDRLKERGPFLAALSTTGLLWSLANPLVGIPSTIVAVGATLRRKTETQRAVVHRKRMSVTMENDLRDIVEMLEQLKAEEPLQD